MTNKVVEGGSGMLLGETSCTEVVSDGAVANLRESTPLQKTRNE